MKINADVVKKLAVLAQLELTKKDIDKYTGQLQSILEYFKKIDEVDITGVEEFESNSKLENVLEDDTPIEPMDKKIGLSQGKNKNGYFVVPKVIEK